MNLISRVTYLETILAKTKAQLKATTPSTHTPAQRYFRILNGTYDLQDHAELLQRHVDGIAMKLGKLEQDIIHYLLSLNTDSITFSADDKKTLSKRMWAILSHAAALYNYSILTADQELKEEAAFQADSILTAMNDACENIIYIESHIAKHGL